MVSEAIVLTAITSLSNLFMVMFLAATMVATIGVIGLYIVNVFNMIVPAVVEQEPKDEAEPAQDDEDASAAPKTDSDDESSEEEEEDSAPPIVISMARFRTIPAVATQPNAGPAPAPAPAQPQAQPATAPEAAATAKAASVAAAAAADKKDQ